jgi:predicted DCC family thiol-disulfide oxidoreductase YuxK
MSDKLKWPDDNVILYDGICILCSRWVRFVAARDTAMQFRFTAIQSDYGRRLAGHFDINPADPDTNAVVYGGVAYFKSDAALIVVSQLPHWRWARGLVIIPKWFRDFFYTLIARNRYRIFGQSSECYLGDALFKTRILT